MANVRMQAMIVTAPSAQALESRTPVEDASGSYYVKTLIVSPSSNVTVIPGVGGNATLGREVLRETLSSVPIISREELANQYRDVGQALMEMMELEDDDEWKIDPAVQRVAYHVAAELLAYSFPAPQVFTHGPKSVVFNWTREPNNLYLTISADRLSALISTPERIKRRLEFSAKGLLNPAAVFPALKSAQAEQPVVSVNEAVSDPAAV